MKQMLIIPDKSQIQKCLELAKEYQLGFEYNDFVLPDVLDDEKLLDEIIAQYKKEELPEYCTMHGAFFDVIPFSMDKRIREVASLRINRSIEIARKMGVKAVVFHTNYSPFLNLEAYVKTWIDTNVGFWSQILEKNQDTNIYLENMFELTPDIIEQLSERLSKYNNYGVCLDWAHASLSKTAPEIWAKKLGRYVKHVHINDNDLISDLHLGWGDGQLNRDTFYKCYNAYLGNATVLVETTPMENKIRSLEMLKKEGFIEN